MSARTTPLALFAYRRPLHTRRVLDSLARCTRLEDCQPVIFCDAPKTPEQAAEVEATRQVAQEWAGEHDARVVLRDENLGLARSIASGVDELCAEFGRVIVVEDDLVVSPDFVDYMLQSLDRYAPNEDVYQVSGFMFPVEQPEKPDAFFLPLTTTWGWATWQRAWRVFDLEAPGSSESLSDPTWRFQFDLGGSFPYSEMLRRRLAGMNDSWGILWWYAVFQAKGLVLHPCRSLVWNGGFDNTGVHSGRPGEDMQTPREAFEEPRLSSPITFPPEVVADLAALERIASYVRNRTARRPIWKRVLKRVGRLRQL